MKRGKVALGSAVVLAGLAGGLAEMLWVMLYGALTGTSSSEVARQITASVLPFTKLAYAVPFGVGVHLGLSLLLAAGFVFATGRPWTRPRPATTTLASAVCVLSLVWAVNFLLLLPSLNPVFVQLLPYSVTLVSKLLFGLAMATVLTVTCAPSTSPALA